MTARWSFHYGFLAFSLLSLFGIGCGQPGATGSGATASNGQSLPSNGQPPTASIGGVEANPSLPEPEKGSPEWLIQEITRIRLLPYPEIAEASDTVKTDEESTEEIDDKTVETNLTKSELAAKSQAQALEERKKLRRERNEQIIDLATECMVKTNKNPDQEMVFNAAVYHLLDSRMQLALQGDREHLDGLYEAAQTLQKRKAGSDAAAAAQLAVVNVTHALAIRFGRQEPRTIQEFAKQSQLFASEFPDEQSQSLPLLLAAGRSCEYNNLMDDAIRCYSVIQTKFPESDQAQQVSGVLRRLDLKGKTLDFGGPTIDGNFVNLEDYREKAVVIVFWAANVKGFNDKLPVLQAAAKKYAKYAGFIGVNLDVDEATVDQFIEEAGMTWPQIFQPEPEERGWNSPLATYYGVNLLPTIWLIDPYGKVVDSQVDVDKLDGQLREMLTAYLRRTADSRP